MQISHHNLYMGAGLLWYPSVFLVLSVHPHYPLYLMHLLDDLHLHYQQPHCPIENVVHAVADCPLLRRSGCLKIAMVNYWRHQWHTLLLCAVAVEMTRCCRRSCCWRHLWSCCLLRRHLFAVLWQFCVLVASWEYPWKTVEIKVFNVDTLPTWMVIY